MGRGLLGTLAVLWMTVLGGSAWAQDVGDVRFYFGLGVGQSLINDDPLPGLDWVSQRSNLTNLTAGVNLGRYFGLELSGDYHFKYFDVPGLGEIGEYGMFALIPQARLRYPLFDGLLVPYVLGGVGVSFNEFNDQEPAGAGLQVHARDAAPVAAVGAGIEYFVADNVALGVQVKYLISRWNEIEIEGLVPRGQANLDTLLLSATIRLLFPETPAARRADRPYAGAGRFYVGARIGGAIPVHEEIADGIEWSPSHNAVSTALGVCRLIGFSLGLNAGEYWGIEVVAQGFTPQLALAGRGDRFGKYAVYSFIPQVRLRYPFLGGQVSPYLLGGVGLGYGEFAHPKPNSVALEPLGGEGYGVAASLGVGVDYFVAKNIALALETNYLWARIPGLVVQGQSLPVNADSFLATVGLRVFFPEMRALWGQPR